MVAARRMGFPVTFKDIGDNILQKSDVGAVVLSVQSETALITAMRGLEDRFGCAGAESGPKCCLIQRMEFGNAELIIGVKNDNDYGPMVIARSGGIHVEALNDVAILPAPVDNAKAPDVLTGPRMAPLLHGARGKPQLNALSVTNLIVRVSWLAHDLRECLAELVLNPVLVKAKG
jgi:hypothetical protein